MAKKTTKQIKEYVASRKDDTLSIFERKGKEYIAFKDEKGRFTGYIERSKQVENAVKSFATKLKITVKFPNQRGKKTITYLVYNEQQKKELLYRMNKKLRTPGQRKNYGQEKGFRKDAVPVSGEKKKIDLLFDKIEYEEVDVQGLQS